MKNQYYHPHVKDVRQEPVGSDDIPAYLRKQDSITGSRLHFQLVPADSWTWVQCSDTIIVSGAVPDDGSVNLLWATGYRSFTVLQSLNRILNIRMYVIMFLYSAAHYNDSFHQNSLRIFSKADIVLGKFLSPT
jgi:hypothetical protein